MKRKINLTLLVVMAMFICTASAQAPTPHPASERIFVQDYTEVDIGGSIEKTVVLDPLQHQVYYDEPAAAVKFIVERGKIVKLSLELERISKGYDVDWGIISEEGYEGLKEGKYNPERNPPVDGGRDSFIHKTLFLDEAGTYYFIAFYDLDDEKVTIHYKIELEDVTPTPAPSPTPTPAPTPGFEAIFTIAGLLAVAYLLRRRK